MDQGLTQRERMLAGKHYFADDPELNAARTRARSLLARFNGSAPEAFAERFQVLSELFDRFGKGSMANPTLRCDYGFNISVGTKTFFNFDCVLLDCHRIEIGDDVQFGPGVHIYTATHPLEAEARRSGAEFALPVTIGSGVWIGGRAIVCPGVKIGENTVVGAGSVVTRDLPAGVLAVGNPCKVVRSIK